MRELHLLFFRKKIHSVSDLWRPSLFSKQPVYIRPLIAVTTTAFIFTLAFTCAAQSEAIPKDVTADNIIKSPSFNNLQARPTMKAGSIYSVESESDLRGRINVEMSPYIILPRFSWVMADRFIDSDDENSLPDLPNTFEYVHNLAPQYCMSNSCDFIEPTFSIDFDAGRSIVIPNRQLQELDSAESLKRVYHWIVIDPMNSQIVTQYMGPNPHWTVTLSEGIYDVSMTIYLASDVLTTGMPAGVVAQNTISNRVLIEDILIVSIGDSFSSGEGNPERGRLNPYPDALWANDGSSSPISIVNQRHRRAHRSTLGWPAQTALSLENADSSTSVTFVSAATTGGTINHGILNPGEGSENEPLPSGGLPAQLDEISQIVGNRRIDVLLMSVGINDIGFSSILHALLLTGEDTETVTDFGGTDQFAGLNINDKLQAISDATNNGDWANVLSAPCEECTGLNSLVAQYQNLSNTLNQRFGENLGEIFIVEYPDPTGVLIDGSLYWCNEVLNDLISSTGGVIGTIAHSAAPDLEIDSGEQQFMVNNLLQQLNTAIRTATAGTQWHLVRHIQSDFANGHGYCAGWPMLRPGEAYYFALGNPYPDLLPESGPTVSWFRTAAQSRVWQGPLSRECEYQLFCVSTAVKSTGQMHPNELGHQAVKSRVLQQVILPVDLGGIGFHDDNDQLSEAETYSGSATDALLYSSDVDVYKIHTDYLTKTNYPSWVTGSEISTPSKKHSGITIPYIPTLAVDVKTLGWRPRVSLFDARGLLLSSTTLRAPGKQSTKLSYKLSTTTDTIFYVAISGSHNDSFDLLTGGRDKGNTRIGQYTLEIKRKNIQISPIAPQPFPG